MTLQEHRARLVQFQDAEQAKTFAQYDDVRYGLICQAIDATDVLEYARSKPDRLDIKGRSMLQLAETRWVRVMNALNGHAPELPE